MSRPVCTDCKQSLMHPDCPQGFCRRCSEKAGYIAVYVRQIDVDKLRSLVGETLAREIVAKCEVL